MPARTRTARDPEAGGVSAELAIAFPLLLMLLTGIVQFALWQHAVQVATAAAQEGVRAARAETGNTEAGQERTERFLRQLGGDLTNPRVQVTRGDDVATVVIEGQTEALIGGLRLPVRATAESPVERFRADTVTPELDP